MGGIAATGGPGGATTARTHGHLVQLDGLRALAALGVILHHFTPRQFPHILGEMAGSGIWLFFVMSGFLITGILIRAKDEATAGGHGLGGVCRAFYLRRFLRIFPLYYAMLAVAAAMNLPMARQILPWHLLYLSNFYAFWNHEGIGPLMHFWTLCVEEQFYLIWPAIVLFAPARWLPAILGFGIAMAPTSRVLTAWLTKSQIATMTAPFSCVDALGAGACLAFLRRGGGLSAASASRIRMGLVAGLLLLSALAAMQLAGVGWRSHMIARPIGYVLVSLWLVNGSIEGFRGPAKAFLEWRPLVYLGTISYGIYVFHLPIPDLAEGFGRRLGISLGYPAEKGVTRLAYVTAASILVASISWFLYERPLNLLKVYFPYIARNRAARSTDRGTGPLATDVAKGQPEASAS